MAVGGNDQELYEFLLETEEAIKKIQQSTDTPSEDMEGILVQAELPLRDVVIVDGLLQPQGGEVIVQAVVDVVATVRDIVDEHHHQHIRGRLQIPISED